MAFAEWNAVPLDAGGGAVQLALEDFYYKRAGVVIAADGAADAARRRGTLQITSQRLIWYDGAGRATSVPAAAIAEASPLVDGFLFNRVHKLRVHVTAPDFWGELRFATKADARAAGEAFVTVRQRLAKEAREEAERAAAEAATEAGRKGRLGIAGIRAARERERLAASKLGAEAFSDLESLMSKAKQIVVLTNRYRTAAEASVDGASASATSAGALAAARSIGIACPVTRDSVGNDASRYHEELAKEIGAFLAAGPLDAAGGLMSMVDVWCHYNRARGADLVSPDDAMDAAALLESLRLGMKLRVFDSGVAVIQSDAQSDEAVAKRVLLLAQDATHAKDGIGVIDVCAAFPNVGIPVAQRMLDESERCGALCRDDSTEGLRFFPNVFLIDAAASSAPVPPT